MNVRTYQILTALALGAALPAGAAFAQAAAPAVTVGTAVKDSNGGDVGTIARVEGQFYILKTDKHEVRLPASAFTPDKGVLLFGMTRDALNAKVEEAMAQAQAKIAPGASVSDPSGAAVATVTAVDPQWVTIKLTSGTIVRLPRASVAPGATGVVVGLTAAQLEAAAKAAPAPAPGK